MRSKRETYELSNASFKETYGCRNTSHHLSKASSKALKEITELSLPRIGIIGTDGTCVEENERENDSKINNTERRISFDDLSSYSESNTIGPQKRNSPSLTPAKGHRMRKVSMGALSSIGGVVQAAVTTRRTKTSSTCDSTEETKAERRVSSILSNIPPFFSRKLASDATSTEKRYPSSGGISGKNPKPIVFSIPASRLAECSHRGFLDHRNKKKQWERYWCVLQDACLYCYHTPQSESTYDVVVLRGYNVIADVTNLNRSRFIFRLQQKGVPTLHFSTENHRDFMLWVGTLEKETRSPKTSSTVKSSSFCDGLSSTEFELSPPPSTLHRTSMPDISVVDPDFGSQQQLERSASQKRSDQKLIEMKKHKLLKEIAVNKRQIAEEQKLLNRIGNTPEINRSSKTRKASRERILDNYEEEKVQQELRTTKLLTFLNCRRNSAYIKMAQYTKDLAPHHGQRRRENHAHVSAMEKKLKDLQNALARIDREFEEEEATKQHNLEKLQRRRDLELLIMEQQDVVNILRRNKPQGIGDVDRRHCFVDTTVLSNSCDALTSIDELSTPSDDRDTSSMLGSSPSVSESMNGKECKKSICRLRRHSVGAVLSSDVTRFEDPCKGKFSRDDAVSSEDGDIGFQMFNVQRSDASPNCKSSDESLYSTGQNAFDARKVSYCSDVSLADVPGQNSALKSKSTPNTDSDIDSSILAKIEDFELFAKSKLEQNESSRKNC